MTQTLAITREINCPLVVAKHRRGWAKHETRATAEINQALVTTDIYICLVKNTVTNIDSRITYGAVVWGLNENRLKN
jgi:hypothetical protein